MAAAITPKFADRFILTCNHLDQNPVHVLFNQFWEDVPPEVAEAYTRQFVDDERLAAFVAEGHYAEPLTVERLAASPPGSLGAAAHRFITGNGLEKNLATNYRRFHQALESSGMLDGMPEPLRYAVLRGFQLHDFLHVVTGYGPSPRDELALQSFCLAQLQFPYFGMWVAVVTTRMTFIAPDLIVGTMDAVTEGWQYGRSVANVQIVRWEERLDEPLADLRRSHGIDPEGRHPLAGAAIGS